MWCACDQSEAWLDSLIASAISGRIDQGQKIRERNNDVSLRESGQLIRTEEDYWSAGPLLWCPSGPIVLSIVGSKGPVKCRLQFL